MEAETFRSQAERCRRLANSIYNIEVASDLEAYAQHLDRCAADLEADPWRHFSGRGAQHSGAR
jgi:hypothetical protein